MTETTIEPLAVSAQEAARLLDLSKPKIYELILFQERSQTFNTATVATNKGLYSGLRQEVGRDYGRRRKKE